MKADALTNQLRAEEPSLRHRFTPYQLLIPVGRETGARDYTLLKGALRRIRSSRGTRTTRETSCARAAGMEYPELELSNNLEENSISRGTGSEEVDPHFVCCSFPLATIVVLLATKYKAMEAESASALLLSTLSLVMTVPIIIAMSR